MSAENFKEKIVPGIGVGILVFDEEGRVLLGKRRSKVANGRWSLPGGKVSREESILIAAKRELEEETSMKLITAEFVSVSYEVLYGEDYMTFGIRGCVEGEPQENAPDEIGEWGWFSLDSLPEPMFLASKRILRNYDAGVIRSVDSIDEQAEL